MNAASNDNEFSEDCPLSAVSLPPLQCEYLVARHAAAHGHLGRALKHLTHLIAEGKSEKAHEEAVAEVS